MPELQTKLADQVASHEHLKKTASVATGYLHPERKEGGLTLTEMLVGVLDRVCQVLQERAVSASSLTLGIANSLYPSINVEKIGEGWEESISDKEAKKLVTDYRPAAFEIVKDVMLDP